MKYLIKDTKVHSLSEINSYFRNELMQTSLKVDDIIIDDTLKVKLAMAELGRIFDENSMANLYDLDLGYIHLKDTGNVVAFSDKEIEYRFKNAYQCILNGCKGI